MSQEFRIFVDGIVSARNKQPYVKLSIDKVNVQLTIAEARKIAFDLLGLAARTEADAMILKFFDKADFPTGASVAIMKDFRDFRQELDAVPVEAVEVDPDTGESIQ